MTILLFVVMKMSVDEKKKKNKAEIYWFYFFIISPDFNLNPCFKLLIAYFFVSKNLTHLLHKQANIIFKHPWINQKNK